MRLRAIVLPFALLAAFVTTKVVAADAELLGFNVVTIGDSKIKLPKVRYANGDTCESYIDKIASKEKGGAAGFEVTLGQYCVSASGPKDPLAALHEPLPASLLGTSWDDKGLHRDPSLPDVKEVWVPEHVD